MKKEEMIEKLREKIIMANNPECKTYEEALFDEYGPGCHFITSKDKIITDVNNVKTIHTEVFRYIVVSFSANTKRYSDVADECFMLYYPIPNQYYKPIQSRCDTKYIPAGYKLNDNFKILGLPLTLERVLVALQYHVDYVMYGNRDHKTTICLKVSKLFSIGFQYGESGMLHIVALWQPNKTLDQQSDETIKAIYDILVI